MWQEIDVRGGPHDGCRLKVTPSFPQPVLWLPAERVADVHAAWSYVQKHLYPLEYRLSADETVYTLYE